MCTVHHNALHTNFSDTKFVGCVLRSHSSRCLSSERKLELCIRLRVYPMLRFLLHKLWLVEAINCFLEFSCVAFLFSPPKPGFTFYDVSLCVYLWIGVLIFWWKKILLPRSRTESNKAYRARFLLFNLVLASPEIILRIRETKSDYINFQRNEFRDFCSMAIRWLGHKQFEKLTFLRLFFFFQSNRFWRNKRHTHRHK